jgi:hypothetical protein
MLRKTYAFDHCIKVDALAASVIAAYNWVSSSGFNITQSANASNGSNSVISLDGWLAFGLTSSWYGSATLVTTLLPGAPASAATKVFFGVRIRAFSTYATNDEVVWFGPSSGAQAILTFADLAPLRGSTPAGTGIDLYLEFAIDAATGNVDIYNNGTFYKTKAALLTAGNKALIASGYYTFSLRQTIWAGPVTTNWFRDIYVIDDVPGDGFVGRQGPQRMFPVYLDSAVGPWVGDDGATDIKATLNAPYPASAQVVSPTDKTPLVLSLAAAIPDGYKVNALTLTLDGKSLGDVPTLSKVEIKQGGVTVPAVNLTTPRTLTYSQPLGVFPLAPDGGVWDINKIDATTVTITPDQ